MGKITIIGKNTHFDQYTGYLTNRQYLMTPRVLLSNLYTIWSPYWPLNNTLVTYRGHRSVQKSPARGNFTILLAYFDQYTGYSTNRQYLMTPRVHLSNPYTIWSPYWPLNNTLVTYRGHRSVQKSPARGNFTILLAYFDQYTGYSTNRQYLMTPRVLISNLTTICSAYWPLDSTLVMYRGHRKVTKSPASGHFTICFIYFDQYTGYMTNRQ